MVLTTLVCLSLLTNETFGNLSTANSNKFVASSMETPCMGDVTAPNLSCKDSLQFSISVDPQNTVPASFFINTVTDNCTSSTITREIRRMDTVCSPTGNVFGPTTRFCCADANTTVTVVIRVTDESANSNTCMVRVLIKEVLPPTIIRPLPNISVSCNYFINVNSLNEFGTLRFNSALVDTIDLDDPIFQALPGDFLDGLVSDNCPANLGFTHAVVDLRNHANTGNIVRNFIVTDGNGNSTTTQQIITVVDNDTLTAAIIQWPADTTYTGCVVAIPTPAMTGSAVVPFDDICTIVGISYKDLVFDYPTSGCKYIRRTWKVIDWSKFVPNTNIGVYTHVQDIHQINTIAPTFVAGVCANKEVCTPNASCNMTYAGTFSATDDCTPTVDLAYKYSININNDGGTPEIIKNGKNINDFLERGTHLVTQYAEDRCGNIAQCSYTLKIKECKAPNAVAYNGLSTNIQENGTVTIWASDFNNKSTDNCTPAHLLKISFSANENDISKTFDCDHLGENPITMWVKDLEGNVTKVNTFILVTDNLHWCPTTIIQSTVQIAGKISTESNDNILGASIRISDGAVEQTLQTDEAGVFKSASLKMYADYYVIPAKNVAWLEGISSLDMVLIQRHILSSSRLNSPYKIIAADVNGDQKITAKDLIDLRKLLLGVSADVPGNKPWRFVDANFVFEDVNHPWPFNEITRYEALDVNMNSTNFIAIKTGDVNASIGEIYGTKDVENRTAREASIVIKDAAVEAGKIINVPVYSGAELDMEALQLSLGFDNDDLDFLGIIPNEIYLENEEYVVVKSNKGNNINIVKADNEGWKIAKDRVLFTLQFVTKSTGKISNFIALDKEVLSPIAYNTKDERYHLNLSFTHEGKLLSVDQNSPNPFIETSQLKFTLNADSPVEINIYNSVGSRIYNAYNHYSAGIHNLNIGNEMLKEEKGVFYMHIETGEMTEIVKMIRIQ